MRLRNVLFAAALGASVITAVPAAVAPHAAYACDDSQSDCSDDDLGGGSGDTGSGDTDTGDSGGGDSGDVDVSTGDVGDTVVIDLDTVTIVAKADPLPTTPADPLIAGSGGGGGDNALVYNRGQIWEERQNCYRNDSNVTEKVTQTISYAVSTQVSTNISASALDVLTATIGTQLNTTDTRTYSMEATLNPGDTWGLFVQYQTSVYAITTHDIFGNYSTQYVNVTAPTGVLTGRSC
ncbi:hypothetical protein OG607_10320 [Streptomyces sp. NBC_01537]|uniref:DUF6426 family protein n=1 Tax=Streptomyces sp. NBC_01537 TaxID=2903896 RepID=UPI003868922A